MGIGGVTPLHAAICRLAGQSSKTNDYGVEVTKRILRYGAPVGCSIEHFRRLPRCMDRLRKQVTEGASTPAVATGTVVRADVLSDSSGRFDRSWHAPAGGLYLALLWADTLLPDFSRLLPFATGIACCEVVRAYGVAANIKWVNDVHVEGRKIAGILCEMVIGSDNERFHLVGIGINVNNATFPDELRVQATGLKLLTGKQFDLDEVCNLLLARLQWNFGLLCYAEEQALAGKGGGAAQANNPLLQRWQQLSDTPGKKVMYGYDVQKNPLYRATALDIDESGGLKMLLGDGSQLTEYSGEINYLHGA